MGNENDSNAPSTKSNSHPSPQSPMPPAAAQEDKMGNKSKTPATQEENETTKLERDIKTGEYWLIGINALLLIANIVIASIYYGQLCQMRKATKAAEGANQIASRALIETNRSWIEIRLSDKDKPRTIEKILSDLNFCAIPLVFTNIGRFPIKNIVMEGSVEITNSNEAVSFHPAAPHFKGPHSKMGMNILFPNRGNDFMAAAFEGFGGIGEMRPLTGIDKRALGDGSDYLMVFARGTFDDIFGKHWVEFCEPIFFGGRAGRYGDCINYNDAGDGDMPNN